MTTLLLDTHVVCWSSIEPTALSRRASEAIASADQLAVAAMTWYELAWMVERGRVDLSMPVDAWLEELSTAVTTVPISPAIARTAVRLGKGFPKDPADRLIYATAVEKGWDLVTKDAAIRGYKGARKRTVW